MKNDNPQFQSTFRLVVMRLVTIVLPLFLGTVIGYFVSGFSNVVISLFLGESVNSFNEIWILPGVAVVNFSFGLLLSIWVAIKLLPELRLGSIMQTGINLSKGIKHAYMSFFLGVFGGITFQGLLIMAALIYSHSLSAGGITPPRLV